MNIAPAISLAASSGIGAGWWIGTVVCMLFMGVMMFAMMGHGRASGGWARWSSGRWPGTRAETPLDVLERRFAEGEISVEDYRERRDALTTDARHGQDDLSPAGRQVASEPTREEEP